MGFRMDFWLEIGLMEEGEEVRIDERGEKWNKKLMYILIWFVEKFRIMIIVFFGVLMVGLLFGN